ncbi:hypothetical protein NKG94_27145 [Micromonospora sp. M12]
MYATIAGWGISSDGKGGITRPEVSGYRLALRRAYERTGFGIETIGLFEGHGTGTKVGDATELEALSSARVEADPSVPPAAIGSVKGMIGHTKAAAGVAGLIKAAMAVHHECCRPPSVASIRTRCSATAPRLRALRRAEAWPADIPRRAGITAMGFGGINTHIVLDNSRPRRRSTMDTRTRALATGLQDAELLVVDAPTATDLAHRLDQLIEFVPSLAYAQLADLAVTLHGELRELPFRAAVVVSSPEDAERRLCTVRDAVRAGETGCSPPTGGAWWARSAGRDGSATSSPARAPGGASVVARCAGDSPRPRRCTCGRTCPPAATWWPPRWPSRASSPALPPACGR